MSDTRPLRIEPLAERHFAGLHQALDSLAMALLRPGL